jgi:superfamily I DNA and/or RNA helicase
VFESLFKKKKKDDTRARPLNTLDMQFRMDDRILKVVRDTFYPPPQKLESAKHLKTSTSMHGLTQPSYVKNQALVWLDTSESLTCRQENPHWSNAGEVEVVGRLVDSLKPAMLRKPDPVSVVVLSPYHHQNDLLRMRVSANLVQTTDSFQGREADVVIVSLVRTNGISVDEPLSRIGHMAAPQRANVLLSRAKKLLVIVGDFTHFASTIGTVWADIGKHVRTHGAVVPAGD